MSITFEQREGRITEREYRVVVTLGEKSATGPWCYTKTDARTHAEALHRSLLPSAEESERIMEAESRRRCANIRTQLEVDRRVTFAV